MIELQLKIQKLSRMILPIFFEISTEGAPKAAELEGPLIIVINHKSYLDQFIVFAALPENKNLFPIRLMAAKWIFSLFGPIVKKFGAFPDKKESGKFFNPLKEPMRILKEKGVVGVYPEGSAINEPGVHELEEGVGLLEIKSRAKILPIVISGLDNFSILRELIIPKWIFKRRRVLVSFGDVFVAESKDRKNAAREIKTKMEKLYIKDYGRR